MVNRSSIPIFNHHFVFYWESGFESNEWIIEGFKEEKPQIIEDKEK